METATRKRPGDGEEEKRRTRARAEDERDRSVTDDEVEEFYAILRRVREAARCFPVREGSGGAGIRRRVAAEGQSRWRPRFEREDFEVGSNFRDDRRRRGAEELATGGEATAEERVAENAIPGRLDLNADPAPEGLDLASPTGDATAHVAS
ncbi:protein NEGATIVE REGULATOR OF RESISTANCE-like [Phoenix dactylifera]|uniref:Protein NEGATIVE REGULATOR OF RESISTANCE-like n=1 Tax=Phoenix dactylifera TaxID=42345 RepID=A0A8B9AFU1_PHODC|nr:protein NEGATIVE REGULATOR OF RESISTANCE-like [Phoenix dactylifera]